MTYPDMIRRAVDELAIIRKRRGLRQKDVAEICGYPDGWASRLECHYHVPTIETLQRYAAAVGATITIQVTENKP